MIARRSKEIKLFFPFTNLIEGTHNITQDIDLNMRVKIFKTKNLLSNDVHSKNLCDPY